MRLRMMRWIVSQWIARACSGIDSMCCGRSLSRLIYCEVDIIPNDEDCDVNLFF